MKTLLAGLGNQAHPVAIAMRSGTFRTAMAAGTGCRDRAIAVAIAIVQNAAHTAVAARTGCWEFSMTAMVKERHSLEAVLLQEAALC